MVDIDLRSFVLFIALQFEAGLLQVAHCCIRNRKKRPFLEEMAQRWFLAMQQATNHTEATS